MFWFTLLFFPTHRFTLCFGLFLVWVYPSFRFPLTVVQLTLGVGQPCSTVYPWFWFTLGFGSLVVLAYLFCSTKANGTQRQNDRMDICIVAQRIVLTRVIVLISLISPNRLNQWDVLGTLGGRANRRNCTHSILWYLHLVMFIVSCIIYRIICTTGLINDPRHDFVPHPRHEIVAISLDCTRIPTVS